jgi:hypothetical protein
VVHEVPADDAKVAEQNFQRGKLAALEDLLDLESDLRKWKESNK